MDEKQTLLKVGSCVREHAAAALGPAPMPCPFYRDRRGAGFVMPECVLCKPRLEMSEDGSLRVCRPSCPLADGGRVVVELAEEQDHG
jgi:hypothetical protein